MKGSSPKKSADRRKAAVRLLVYYKMMVSTRSQIINSSHLGALWNKYKHRYCSWAESQGTALIVLPFDTAKLRVFKEEYVLESVVEKFEA